MLRLWFLILCVIAGAFAPSRAPAREFENRTRDFFAFSPKTHQETESQAVEPHQEKTADGYETALGYPQAAENAVPRTVGQIVGDAHPDSMVHLTPFGKESFAGGIDKGTYFARLGDVSKMDIPTFQADVVGRAAAASPGQPVAGFVVVRPGQAPFTQAGVFNNAGVMEYINPSATTGAPSYITLPK